MWNRVDWGWVREWAIKVYGTLVLLLTFAYLTATPVVRPGGVMAALPDAVLFAVVAAIPIAGIVAAVLAYISAQRRS